MARRRRQPRYIIIAGPNGAGKTTFARRYLPENARVLHFVNSRLALRRIAARVRQGGHDVPKSDVVRRFVRSWDNFERVYRPLADSWAVYENSDREPQLLERGP